MVYGDLYYLPNYYCNIALRQTWACDHCSHTKYQPLCSGHCLCKPSWLHNRLSLLYLSQCVYAYFSNPNVKVALLLWAFPFRLESERLQSHWTRLDGGRVVYLSVCYVEQLRHYNFCLFRKYWRASVDNMPAGLWIPRSMLAHDLTFCSHFEI